MRLIGTALRRIADEPETQAQLRANRDLVPRFIEEVLRTEGPILGEYRLAVKTTELGGVPIPAGTPVLLSNGAANRDPRQFECPAEFRANRENVRRHIAFGHGIHTCPGAPLARSEARITVERLLDRTTDIRINEEAHGPAGSRRYDYMPTYMFRGLTTLTSTSPCEAEPWPPPPHREIRVDRSLCMGSGQCCWYAPNTFDQDDETIAIVTDPRRPRTNDPDRRRVLPDPGDLDRRRRRRRRG